ncbi:MAG TPA: trypsin-like peptidase domain-containing protein [Pirellulales bacterium]|nr:trypsin-like peptidase domain-containing protein [Pirellulales bacterium]
MPYPRSRTELATNRSGLVVAAVLFVLTIPARLAAQSELVPKPTAAVRAQPVSARFGFGPQTPHPAVVRVISPERNGASLGSGTLVDVSEKHGLVITNWHVVKDAAGNVIVSFPDGFQTPGYVIKMDRDWDLAAVAIWRPRVQPVPIAPEIPQRGEPLAIAGYGSGDYRAQAGRCTQYLSPGAGLPFDMVEVSAAARHGDSGGPIFNARGELAGVLFGEGGGMTSGSASARVRWFLASIGGGKTNALPATQFAATSTLPARPNANLPSPLADFGERGRTGEEPDFGERSRTGVKGQNGLSFSQQPSSPNGDLLVAVPAPQSAYPPPSSYPSTNAPAPTWPPSQPASSHQSADPFARPPGPVPAAISSVEPNLQPATEQVSWEDLAGHTPGQQFKTALAVLGVLMLLYQATRRLG